MKRKRLLSHLDASLFPNSRRLGTVDNIVAMRKNMRIKLATVACWLHQERQLAVIEMGSLSANQS